MNNESYVSNTGRGKGDCVKYFEAVMTDPVLQVTPLHAFTHMWSKCFFYPLSVLAHNLSEFVDIVTGKFKKNNCKLKNYF